MQATRNLIYITAKFTPRMEDRINNPCSRDLFGGMQIHRYAASVIFHNDPAVFLQCQMQFIAEPCQMFINSIVQNLPYHMVQPPGSCTADVHTRTFAHCFQSLQNNNITTTIICTHLIQTLSEYPLFPHNHGI